MGFGPGFVARPAGQALGMAVLAPGHVGHRGMGKQQLARREAAR
jgi:hypothetical protein